MIITSSCDRGDRREERKTAKPASAAEESKPAPDIVLTPLEGKDVRISELKGDVLLLNFWATWCPPCREEVPSLARLDRKMSGKKFRMLAASIDEGGKSAIEAFFKSTGNSLPAYTVSQEKAADIYGITGVPETFIIDRNGIIVKKVIGPIEWDDQEVIAFIENLMK